MKTEGRLECGHLSSLGPKIRIHVPLVVENTFSVKEQEYRAMEAALVYAEISPMWKHETDGLGYSADGKILTTQA